MGRSGPDPNSFPKHRATEEKILTTLANLESDEGMWSNEIGVWTSKEKAVKGVYEYEGKRWRITPDTFDQWVADRTVNEKIVADYEGRIRGLKDKVAALKTEIVGTNVLQ